MRTSNFIRGNKDEGRLYPNPHRQAVALRDAQDSGLQFDASVVILMLELFYSYVVISTDAFMIEIRS